MRLIKGICTTILWIIGFCTGLIVIFVSLGTQFYDEEDS